MTEQWPEMSLEPTYFCMFCINIMELQWQNTTQKIHSRRKTVQILLTKNLKINKLQKLNCENFKI
jgi:hypothetical protein